MNLEVCKRCWKTKIGEPQCLWMKWDEAWEEENLFNYNRFPCHYTEKWTSVEEIPKECEYKMELIIFNEEEDICLTKVPVNDVL